VAAKFLDILSGNCWVIPWFPTTEGSSTTSVRPPRLLQRCPAKPLRRFDRDIVSGHVTPISTQELFVVDYAGKAIKRRRFSYDDILILPRTSNELRQGMSVPIAGVDREMKDFMRLAANTSALLMPVKEAAASYGVQERARNVRSRVTAMMPSRSLSSSSAREASTNAMRDTVDASGDLPQAGDQSELFGVAQRESER
jgi:hypothetical protein